jgi:hypothetical protein
MKCDRIVREAIMYMRTPAHTTSKFTSHGEQILCGNSERSTTTKMDILVLSESDRAAVSAYNIQFQKHVRRAYDTTRRKLSYLNILMLEPDMYIMNAFIIKFLPGAAASSIALFCFIASCCFALIGSIACTQQQQKIGITCFVSDRYRDRDLRTSCVYEWLVRRTHMCLPCSWKRCCCSQVASLHSSRNLSSDRTATFAPNLTLLQDGTCSAKSYSCSELSAASTKTVACHLRLDFSNHPLAGHSCA